MFEICFILYKSTFFKKEEKGKKELSGAHKYIKVLRWFKWFHSLISLKHNFKLNLGMIFFRNGGSKTILVFKALSRLQHFVLYMSLGIAEIRHFRKCVGNWGNPLFF